MENSQLSVPHFTGTFPEYKTIMKINRMSDPQRIDDSAIGFVALWI